MAASSRSAARPTWRPPGSVGRTHELRLARPASAPADALAAIWQADVIVLGASDFYFNLLGPLQLDGLRAAITASRATKIYVCNLVAQPGPTARWPASRFVRRVLEALGGPAALDYVIINSAGLNPALLARQRRSSPEPGQT